MHARLQQKRQEVLNQIAAIDRLRQGHLSEQYYQRTLQDGKVRRQGPYYVLQSQRGGRKHSTRIPPEQAEQVRHDVENYQRFRQLTQELAELTEQCTMAMDAPTSKKNSRRSDGRALRRSRRSSSGS